MDFITVGLFDVIDIVVVALLFYQIYRWIRGTAAMTIFAGVILVYVLWIVVRALNMTLLSSILGQVIGVGVLALIIVFQQEVRRYLLLLGRRYSKAKNKFIRRIFKSASSTRDYQWTEDVARACRDMATTRTGALICIERQGDLSGYAATGDTIDARIDIRLIESIFFKNSPLHDGAVIIKQERLHAARCILPSSDNPHIPQYFGMRHRAAVGLTEQSDAVVIVVSEERGKISLVVDGEIQVITETDKLGEKLVEVLTA